MSGKKHIIISRFIGLLVFAIIAIPVVIQIPAIQTRLIKKITSALETVLDGQVSIGSIQLKLSGALAVNNLVIVDGHPYTDGKHDWAPADTIADIGLITGTIRVHGLLNHEGIHLGRIHIHNGYFHLVSEPTDYRSNISRLLGVKPAENPPPQEKYPVFDIRRIRLDNVRFLMNNYIIVSKENDLRSPYGVHFEDMDAMVEKLKVNNLRFAYGRMSGVLTNCRISEKRGYCLQSLKAKFASGSGLTTVQNLHLVDKWSEVTLDQVTMDYSKGTKAFMRFITDVKLAISTDNGGHLDVRTISGICGALYGNESVYELRKIRAEGTIDNIKVKTLDFKELKTGVSGSLKCDLTGLPDIQKFFLDGKIKNVAFTPVKGCDFTAYWAKNFRLKIPGEQNFLLNGSVHGLLKDLKIKVNIASKESGVVDGDIVIKNIQDPKGRPITVGGYFGTRELAAGEICGINNLGPASIRSNVFLELVGKSPDFRIDSLEIDKFGFYGHNYSGITAYGYKQQDKILARIYSRDSSVTFDMLADCSGKMENGDLSVKMAADIEKIDLHKSGLIRNSDDTSLLSTSINARLENTGKDVYNGNLEIAGLVLTNSDGPHHVGDISASMLHDGKDSIVINSRFAEIRYGGTPGIGRFLQDLKNITLAQEFPALDKSADKPEKAGRHHAELVLHDCRELLGFFMPDAYIQDGSSVTIDSDSLSIKASAKSGRLALGSNYLRDLDLKADNLGDKISATINVGEISALGMQFDKSVIRAEADSNNFFAGLKYAIKDREDDFGNIFFRGNIDRDERDSLIFKIMPSNSSLTIGGEEWKWNDSEIRFGGGKIHFDDFNISSAGKMLKLDGGISRNTRDSINLELKGIGLDILKKINVEGPDIGGTLSGYATLISPLNGQYKVLGKISCDSLSINGTNGGDFTLAGKWDDRKQTINIFLENRMGSRKALTSYAYINPLENRIMAEATLDKMCPSVVMPFLTGVLDDMGGSVSGKIKAEGPLKKISIHTDKLSLDPLSLTLSATGVSYSLEGPLQISGEGLVLNHIQISDGAHGKGSICGSVNLQGPDKASIDARLDFSNMLLIDSSEKMGQAYYGKLEGSGNASISGPFSRLNINALLTTTGEGNVHIPLGSSVTSVNSNLLTFVEKERKMDEYEAMISARKEKKVKSSSSDISINATINATPGVKAVIEIDKATGNVLSAFGEGSVKAYIRPAKDILNLEGKYNISGGEYHFQTAAIINKEFTIQNGSSLNFNGPIKDCRLDVSALYNLKTSLNTLIADSSSVNSRRPVRCGIHISEKINNLNLGFSIDVPDLDPSTRARVESALNTEDKVQRQFASLLIFGTFMPSEQSGVVNSRNMLYSNVSEMMSGQINQIFQKLDIPVDLGFGYQQNEGGTDIFDVAISTQLFNNRVIINGSVGNRKYKTSSNPYGDVVGDLDIEIKIDKSGKLRGTLFSHSADEYTNFLDYSQRNGLGISYQLEYDRVRNLFKKPSELQESKKDSLKVIHVQRSPESKSSR